MSTPIRLLLLNDFSAHWDKIVTGLGWSGLDPETYQPQNKEEFLEQLTEHDPDAILISIADTQSAPPFIFKEVQSWLAEREITLPIWMIIEPQDEQIAAEAMYSGLTDYFFTDRLARLNPIAVRLIGRHKPIFEPVNLNQIVEKVVGEHIPSFNFRALPLTFLPGADLPEFSGEPIAFSQAVQSLLKTVLEAVPPDTRVDIRSYLDAVKGEVCLETKLSGQGLQTEQQIEETAVTDITLKEAAEKVEMQNGRLDIDNGEEFGIRVCFAFPAILKTRIAGTPKLLVVENSLLMRSILQEALEQEGFKVKTAENGKEGLDTIARYQPDLIISDIIMPIMDGFAFFEAVRANPDWQEIPFIFVTGQSDQREYLNNQVLRGATYLIKPIIIEELLVAIRSRLSS